MSIFDGWGFTSPYALFALFGLLVPLVIHFLSKSKGKLIPFGNIRLIQQTKPTRMREIRLVEILLLICRLLILFFSILLLANLYQNQIQENTDKLLISEDWLNNASAQDKTRLLAVMQDSDSYLLSRNFDVLTRADVQGWEQKLSSKNDKTKMNNENIWLLANHFTETLNESTLVSVYTTNRYNQFNHNKVRINHDIQWHIKEINIEPIDYDALYTPLKITIVYDENKQTDLAYLVKALSLIKQDNINLVTFNQAESSDKLVAADWVFYLSSKVVSQPVLALVDNGSILVVESSVITEHTDSLAPLFTNGLDDLPSNVLSKTTVYTRFIEDLVTYEIGLGQLFVIGSKSDLAWPTLLAQIQFPQMLLSLITFDHIKVINNQQQRLTDAQISTNLSYIFEPNQAFDNPFKYILFNPNVIQYLAFLLVLFWLFERILSEFVLIRKANFK